MNTAIASVLLALIVSGCKQTEIRLADGSSFKRTTFGYTDKVSEMSVTHGTNQFTLKGFTSDADKALSVADRALGIAQAAATAAK